MSRTLLIAFSTCALAGCVNQVQPIRLTRFVPLEAGCALAEGDGVLLPAGTLDVAAGGPQFTIGVEITGEGFTQRGLKLSSGEVLEGTTGSRPIITEFVIDYRLSRRIGPTPKQFVQKLTLPATGTSGKLIIRGPLNIISADLADILVNGLTPSNAMDDFVDVDIDVTANGEIADSRVPISTGSLTFPLRVYRSAPTATCTAFKRFPFTDPGTMGPDFCRYVGREFGNVTSPAPPTDCCNPGDLGC